MSRHFKCDPIRNRNKAGDLESSGVAWTEQASWRGGTNRATTYLSLLLCSALFLAFFVSLFNGGGTVGFIGSIIFAACIAFNLRAIFGALPARKVMFERDGTISVPLGIPRDKNARTLNANQDDIASIEVGPNMSGMPIDWTSSVRIITRLGSTIPVGQILHNEEARNVAVALNVALKDMRDARNAPQATLGAGWNSNDLID